MNREVLRQQAFRAACVGSTMRTLSAETYNYDGAGNLLSKVVDGVTTTYGYDNADQITSETSPTYSSAYSYDHNGNRLSKTLGGTTQTYAYDNGDKLLTVSQGGTAVKTYGYDAAGRTTSVATSSGTTTLSYDYESRVTGISYPGGATNSFTYNGLDTRTGKTDSGGTKSFLRDGTDVTSPVLSDGAATYSPGISESRTGVSTFYAHDRLGTNNLQTSASQIVTNQKVYDSFGMLESSTGSTGSPFGFVGALGYQEDSDSGLMLLGHRYYDSSVGRFLSRDPVKDGRNWYCYVENNPLKRTDSSGLFSVLKALGALVTVVAIVGIIVEAPVIVIGAGVAGVGLILFKLYKKLASALSEVDSNQNEYNGIDNKEKSNQISPAQAESDREGVETGKRTKHGLHELGDAVIEGEDLSNEIGLSR